MDSFKKYIEEARKPMTPEKRAEYNRRQLEKLHSLSPEQKAEYNRRRLERYHKLSLEERNKYNRRQLEKFRSLSPEQKAEYDRKELEKLHSLSPEQKAEYDRKKREKSKRYNQGWEDKQNRRQLWSDQDLYYIEQNMNTPARVLADKFGRSLESIIKIKYSIRNRLNNTDIQKVKNMNNIDKKYFPMESFSEYYNSVMEDMTSGAGGVFGDGPSFDHGGDFKSEDWYAEGDARVPKSIFTGVIRRPKVNKKGKKKKNVVLSNKPK